MTQSDKDIIKERKGEGKMREKELSLYQENYEDEIDLVELIKILYSYRKMIFIITFIGILCGGIVGYLHDSKRETSYMGNLEFIYKPDKIENSEDLEMYFFKIYMMNTLLKKESLTEGLSGKIDYKVPTIVLGENTLAIKEKDMNLYSHSYKLNVENYDKESVERDLNNYYENVRKEMQVLGYGDDNFLKLRSSVIESIEKSKINLMIIIGTTLGIFMGVFSAFSREFLKGVDFKNN